MKERYDFTNNSNISENNLLYLRRLYKTYLLVFNYVKGDITLNKENIDKLEDRIYTVNGKVLSDEDRIKLEFSRIMKKVKDINLIKQKEVSSYIELLNSLLKDNLSDDVVIYIKKIISLLQVMLDMPNSFLYASLLVFKEEYRNYEMSIYDNGNIDKSIYKEHIYNKFIDNEKKF